MPTGLSRVGQQRAQATGHLPAHALGAQRVAAAWGWPLQVRPWWRWWGNACEPGRVRGRDLRHDAALRSPDPWNVL